LQGAAERGSLRPTHRPPAYFPSMKG
jgi:hypothetical protein